MEKGLKTSDFDYSLPDELVARYPAGERCGSRLLHLDRNTGEVYHRQFVDFPSFLQPGDLLVFNNTRVIPARLHGEKASGGKVEVLVERITGKNSCLAQVRASKSPKPGSELHIDESLLKVEGRKGEFFQLELLSGAASLMGLLKQAGHMPLPPYIDRSDETLDEERYQTVYSQVPGAVAAPTAGLHFDEPLLASIKGAGIDTGFVTLHVGAGTFQPVRVEDINEHTMHGEWFSVDSKLQQQVAASRERGGRVIAVGTTSVRCLESAAEGNAVKAMQGDTDIFITPGYEFKVVDALLTNFHLPRSTLLMLVSALAGRENILRAYEEAVEQRYRFFSYGDAMFIT